MHRSQINKNKPCVRIMDKAEIFSFLLIFLGILLVIHHFIFWQRLFDIADMMHHEFFEAIFFTAGITLLMATRLKLGRSVEK